MSGPTSSSKDLYIKIEQALDTIRPYLITDGGNVQVLELTDEMVLRVELLGNCRSCVMSAMTLKTGIEEAVLNSIPEIKAVEAVNLNQLEKAL